ncbi:hypothetical protein PFICI_13263 [Pestalotiopsis fici W106-1]|uniref:Uncharacterized protein n=1 Tax=Pestalotiopsis fici (strain W106-1 / CGMCC3.15140) TaxID=1229662 RepID=W3WM02_PESFW|nr:uncharacterized protein PFICI_13263 [Pestalotiopsis fici W106-1]ETS74779.1 hypothetical protein PFICI_13263 [Pestalotiopsis fici W106-1]
MSERPESVAFLQVTRDSRKFEEACPCKCYTPAVLGVTLYFANPEVNAVPRDKLLIPGVTSIIQATIHDIRNRSKLDQHHLQMTYESGSFGGESPNGCGVVFVLEDGHANMTDEELLAEVKEVNGRVRAELGGLNKSHQPDSMGWMIKSKIPGTEEMRTRAVFREAVSPEARFTVFKELQSVLGSELFIPIEIKHVPGPN